MGVIAVPLGTGIGLNKMNVTLRGFKLIKRVINFAKCVSLTYSGESSKQQTGSMRRIKERPQI
jgi:hypothetical protein